MIIFIILLLPAICFARDGPYECGPNGRFEYCIDDIPGCVIGCHCYPGYYFDTDTKICEPNTKLTQGFRRHYSEDARPREPPASTEPPPSSTAAPALEQQVDEIAKDNSDLSDWLYNQFFKTIENQVINKTDNDEVSMKGTRRSGGPALKRNFNKNKRSKKGKKSSKKTSKHGLRRKLLRISGDDSMFESSSDSSSGSEETSSSSSWETWGEEPEPKGHNRDDKDHGHRKIVVYSKRPKPPLPSFIFLPNIETPFYPPIGLPAPALPMYPMIPVPPIHPPECDEENSHSTVENKPINDNVTTTTAITTTTSVATTKASTSSPTSTENLPPTENPPPNENATPSEQSPSEETPTLSEITTPAGPPDQRALKNGRSKLLRSQARNNLLQRLKERNRKQHILKNMGSTGQRFKKTQKNQLMGELRDLSTFTGNIFQQPNVEESPQQDIDAVLPFEDDVDFKYLTQLIHRVDMNKSTTQSPTMEFNPNKEMLMNSFKTPARYHRLKKHPVVPGLLRDGGATRRRFDATPGPPDDSYYTNLGRQIATLIRGAHPDDAAQIDIDLDHESETIGSPFFSENSFAPRSYWERFVRSPLRLDLGSFTKFENLKASNEKLFDLESKVEVAAHSQPVLSLLELENVITGMQNVQNQISSRQLEQKNRKPSSTSLNISLLPRPRGKAIDTPITTSQIKVNTRFNKDIAKVVGEKPALNRISRRNNYKHADTIIFGASKRMQLNHTNNKHLSNRHNELQRNVRLTSTIAPNIALMSQVSNSRSSSSKFRLSPTIFNQNNRQYSNNNNNNYSNFPIKATEPDRTSNQKLRPSSYFFNEFNFFV